MIFFKNYKAFFYLKVTSSCLYRHCFKEELELNNETKENEHLLIDSVVEYNVTLNIEGCSPERQACGNAGNIDVVNDQEFLYVSIIAANGFYLTKASLHLAGSLSEFPTVGQGNLPAGQLEH